MAELRQANYLLPDHALYIGGTPLYLIPLLRLAKQANTCLPDHGENDEPLAENAITRSDYTNPLVTAQFADRNFVLDFNSATREFGPLPTQMRGSRAL